MSALLFGAVISCLASGAKENGLAERQHGANSNADPDADPDAIAGQGRENDALRSSDHGAKDRWYKVVDIGLAVSRGSVEEQKVSEAMALSWFDDVMPPHPVLSFGGRKHFEEERIRHPKEGTHGTDARPGDRAYRSAEGPLMARVQSFSSREVRLWVIYVTGHSRWIEFSDLVGDIVVDRTPAIDARFGLVALEAQYSMEVGGVRHGMSIDDAIARLGGRFVSSPQQSTLFVRFYFPAFDVELVGQEGRVMYLERGKPAWVDDLPPNIDREAK